MSELKWVPVSEKLPDEEGYYMCTVKDPSLLEELVVLELYYGHPIAPNAYDKTYCFGDYAFGEKWPNGMDNIEEVIAWMPLPEPYKEGEDDNT